MTYELSDSILIQPLGNDEFKLIDTKTEVKIFCKGILVSLITSLNGINNITKSSFLKSLKKDIPLLSDAEIVSLFDQLLVTGFLLPVSNSSIDPIIQVPEFDWDEYGWGSAKLFHQSIHDTTFIQGTPDGWKKQLDVGKEYLLSSKSPDIKKEYTDNPTFILPEVKQSQFINFFSLVKNRRTCRDFTDCTEGSIEDLALILEYSSKTVEIIENDYFGRHVLKTVPSGGGRHPVEVYPQLINISGITGGSYYYDHIENNLRYIGTVSLNEIQQFTQNQLKLSHNCFSFIITARFSRNLWKYRYSKSYLFTHYDVGHYVQNLIMCCEATGYRCFLTPAVNVNVSLKHLRLTNIYDECPVYIVVAGKF